jgi:hypothetical protein
MLAAAMARTKTMVLQQQLLLVVEGNLAPIVPSSLPRASGLMLLKMMR